MRVRWLKSRHQWQRQVFSLALLFGGKLAPFLSLSGTTLLVDPSPLLSACYVFPASSFFLSFFLCHTNNLCPLAAAPFNATPLFLIRSLALSQLLLDSQPPVEPCCLNKPTMVSQTRRQRQLVCCGSASCSPPIAFGTAIKDCLLICACSRELRSKPATRVSLPLLKST